MIRLIKTGDNTLILYLGKKRQYFKLLYIIEEDDKGPKCSWCIGSGRYLSSSEFSIGVRNEGEYEFVKETFKEFHLLGVSMNPHWYGSDLDDTWYLNSPGYITDLICHAHFYGINYKKRLTFLAPSPKGRVLEIIRELRRMNYLVIWRPLVPGVGRNLILG